LQIDKKNATPCFLLELDCVGVAITSGLSQVQVRNKKITFGFA